MATETTQSNANDNQSKSGADRNDSAKQDETKSKTPTASGDPGATPGSAEGDEETIDEDIREKEAEGKL